MDRRSFLRAGLGVVGSAIGRPAPISRIVAHPAVGSRASGPPPAAAAAGFERLDFYDDFDDPATVDTRGTNDVGGGFNWYAGLWFTGPPHPSIFIIENSIITINGGAGGWSNAIQSTTSRTPTAGRRWTGGYFEIRAKASNWTGLVLYSYRWASDLGCRVIGAYGGGAELDILETTAADPDNIQGWEHSNSMARPDVGCAGSPADQSRGHWSKITSFPALGSPATRAWHIYGCLWTKSTVAWYVDNLKVDERAALPELWQPMLLSLGIGPGGANTGKRDDPVTLELDWVKVWQS